MDDRRMGTTNATGLLEGRHVDKGLLSDQVYEAIRAEIVTGKFRPGERLVESEIARRLEVSQAPVREALRQLAHEGLVLQLPRRGTFVAEISEEDARRSYEVREALEAVAARDFCLYAGDEALEELATLLAEIFEAAEQRDPAGLMDADMAFHRFIWSAGGNPLLPRIFPLVESAARNLTAISNQEYFNELEIAESHVPLVETLRARNIDEAITAHQAHVREVWQRFEAGRGGGG
jgi:DNA-binding GntR family transcriptional regulator